MAVFWSLLWVIAAIPFSAILYGINIPILKVPFLTMLLGMMPQFAAIGAAAGAFFSLIFMAAERNNRLDQLSTRRVGLWGLLGGIAFPAMTIIPYAFSQGLSSMTDAAIVFGLTGLIGTGCAVASLALARKAPAPAAEPLESGT